MEQFINNQPPRFIPSTVPHTTSDQSNHSEPHVLTVCGGCCTNVSKSWKRTE
ncbi:hypothetical protein NQZ68_013369 [Dissostichus eleginoides]|nr:hypothetical protein NQZ68_013369 [Dissostichus eleginoides]